MKTADNIFAGCFLLILCSILFLNNIICTSAIVRHKELLKLSAYKLMASMILIDSIQLLIIAFFGLQTTVSLDLNVYLAKAIGGLVNSCWITNTLMGTVLAFNRCTAVFNKGEFLFVGNRCFVWISVVLLYGLSFLTVYMSTEMMIFYDYDNYYMTYSNQSLSTIMCTTEMISDFATTAFMLICYVAVWINLWHRRKNTSRNSLTAIEKRALFQSFSICLMISITFTSWFVFPKIFSGKWPLFFCTTVWIICSGNA